jgi:hypothetical protein
MSRGAVSIKNSMHSIRLYTVLPVYKKSCVYAGDTIIVRVISLQIYIYSTVVLRCSFVEMLMLHGKINKLT